jgi:hypothetical protein
MELLWNGDVDCEFTLMADEDLKNKVKKQRYLKQLTDYLKESVILFKIMRCVKSLVLRNREYRGKRK